MLANAGLVFDIETSGVDEDEIKRSLLSERAAPQEIAEKLQPFVGRKLRLKILEVNRKANRLILSEKVALYEERREKRDRARSRAEALAEDAFIDRRRGLED